MPKIVQCRHCGELFEPLPRKPGLIDECLECIAKLGIRDVAMDMAGVTWENKHTPVLEITTPKQAKRINGAQKRFGASVTRALAPQSGDKFKETRDAEHPDEGNSAKWDSAAWTSTLLEKHDRKR